MSSRYEYEAKFDRAQQRAQRRNDEIVKKFRHRAQNVYKVGEMFRLREGQTFYIRNRNGVYVECYLGPGELVISMSDSSQMVSFLPIDRHDIKYFKRPFLSATAPYHVWPFLYGVDIVWMLIQKSEDPMRDLRGTFFSRFKVMK